MGRTRGGLARALVRACALASAVVLPAFAQDESAPAAADDGQSARLYVTNQERREIGRRIALTPWLGATALFETERLRRHLHAAHRPRGDRIGEVDSSVQLGLFADASRELRAEAVFDYSSDADEIIADEAIVAFERGPWELEAGRLFTPLGVFISNFATGPLLEFGESRVDGAALSYAVGPLDLKLVGYRGKARRRGSNGFDWSAGIEARFGDALVGAGYQSDLADSEAQFVREFGQRYARRVDAASAFVQYSGPGFDLSFEALRALRRFRELERDRDQPLAWNIELAHFFHAQFSWALRWEGSRELEDAPRRQAGVALTWRPGPRASLTVEYLQGRFGGRLATDADDEPYRRVRQIGAQLSIAY